MTITGVNLTVAAGLVAAIGDIGRFKSPQKLVSYFGLNPACAPVGARRRTPRAHQQGWPLPRARHACRGGVGGGQGAGPLHAFFVRIRAKRGHQIAAVAVARKLTVLCWHLLTKDDDYLWARPALVANKTRAMELQAGQPAAEGQPTRSCLRLQHQDPAGPGDAARRAGRASLRTLRGAVETAIAEGQGARAPQSGRTRMRSPGERFQPMRHASPRGHPRPKRIIPWDGAFQSRHAWARARLLRSPAPSATLAAPSKTTAARHERACPSHPC